MTSLICNQVLKLSKPSGVLVSLIIDTGYPASLGRIQKRFSATKGGKETKKETFDTSGSSELVTNQARELLQKEFPEYYDGDFSKRTSYVDYVHQALDRLKELGLERDRNAYHELLKIFPEGRYHRKGWYDIGLHHAPQQIAGLRIIREMNKYLVKPTKETEILVIKAFGKSSDVWNSVARAIYWSMKGRNIDLYPIPEKVPEKAYDIAKVALIRMLDDPKSVITVTSTATIPDAVDRTWLVYAQSPIQQSIIERLDKKNILYIEETGLTYIKDKYLTYFTLKVYDDEEAIRARSVKPTIDFNYNTLKMKFYGKPIREKIEEMGNIHHIGDCQILAIGLTGTSSQDSILSWLKLLQRRNPNLRNLNVVFRFKRPTQDIAIVDEDEASAKQQ